MIALTSAEPSPADKLSLTYFLQSFSSGSVLVYFIRRGYVYRNITGNIYLHAGAMGTKYTGFFKTLHSVTLMSQ